MSGRGWTVATHTMNAHRKAWRLVGDGLLRKLHERGEAYAATLPRERLYQDWGPFHDTSNPRHRFFRRVYEALDWCVAANRYVPGRRHGEAMREERNLAYAVTVERWAVIFAELADEVAAEMALEARLADEARRRVVSLDDARARRAERWRPSLDRTPGPLTAAGQRVRVRVGVVVPLRGRE